MISHQSVSFRLKLLSHAAAHAPNATHHHCFPAITTTAAGRCCCCTRCTIAISSGGGGESRVGIVFNESVGAMAAASFSDCIFSSAKRVRNRLRERSAKDGLERIRIDDGEIFRQVLKPPHSNRHCNASNAQGEAGVEVEGGEVPLAGSVLFTPRKAFQTEKVEAEDGE